MAVFLGEPWLLGCLFVVGIVVRWFHLADPDGVLTLKI
jgi:hypothetical protein